MFCDHQLCLVIKRQYGNYRSVAIAQRRKEPIPPAMLYDSLRTPQMQLCMSVSSIAQRDSALLVMTATLMAEMSVMLFCYWQPRMVVAKAIYN